MKHIPKWLSDKLSASKIDAEYDQPSVPGKAEPEATDLGVDLPEDLHDFLTEAPIPDIYSDASDATVPNIIVVDSEGSDGDKLTGYNPYDTVKMHKKEK